MCTIEYLAAYTRLLQQFHVSKRIKFHHVIIDLRYRGCDLRGGLELMQNEVTYNIMQYNYIKYKGPRIACNGIGAPGPGSIITRGPGAQVNYYNGPWGPL